MFKLLSTTIITALVTILFLFLTSQCFNLMNLPSTPALIVGIVSLLILWLLAVPYFYKWVWKRYASFLKGETHVS